MVRRAHDAGITAATQVGDLRAAARAAEAGIDVVIARGAEGGGHDVAAVVATAAWGSRVCVRLGHGPDAHERQGAVLREHGGEPSLSSRAW